MVSQGESPAVRESSWLWLPARTAVFYLTAFAIAALAYSLAWDRAPLITEDTLNYVDAARDLADGRLDELRVRTAGYPLLLLATGSLPRPGRPLFFTQLGLHLVTVWLGGVVLARSGAGGWLTAAFAAIALLPPYVYLTGVAMSESLAQCVLMIVLTTFWMYFRSFKLLFLLVCALALSYAVLTRPGLLPLAVVLPAGVLGRLAFMPQRRPAGYRRLGGLVLITILPVASVAAYSMFNRAKFGYFGLSPLVAWNLAVRTTPFYDEIADPGLRAPLVAERNRRYAAGQNVYHAVFEVDNDLLYRGGRPLVERSQSLRRMALTLIRRNKTQYLQEVARSLATFWFPKEYFEPGLDLPDLRRWDSQSLARARGRGGELYLPPAMIKLSKAVEGGMTLAFFGSLTIVIGILAIGLPISGSWAVAFFTCAAIVIGNAITACAVDMGLVRQRGSTDVLLLLGAFLGWLLLREARRRARGTIGA